MNFELSCAMKWVWAIQLFLVILVLAACSSQGRDGPDPADLTVKLESCMQDLWGHIEIYAENTNGSRFPMIARDTWPSWLKRSCRHYDLRKVRIEIPSRLYGTPIANAKPGTIILVAYGPEIVNVLHKDKFTLTIR